MEGIKVLGRLMITNGYVTSPNLARLINFTNQRSVNSASSSLMPVFFSATLPAMPLQSLRASSAQTRSDSVESMILPRTTSGTMLRISTSKT